MIKQGGVQGQANHLGVSRDGVWGQEEKEKLR